MNYSEIDFILARSVLEDYMFGPNQSYWDIYHTVLSGYELVELANKLLWEL